MYKFKIGLNNSQLWIREDITMPYPFSVELLAVMLGGNIIVFCCLVDALNFMGTMMMLIKFSGSPRKN